MRRCTLIRTSQRWGKPICSREHLERKGFTFWVNRLKYSSRLYDIIRIAPFRAFGTCWKIPASCETAVEGQWVEAPGDALFRELYRAMDSGQRKQLCEKLAKYEQPRERIGRKMLRHVFGSPNWEWRLTDRRAFVRELVAATGRAPAK